MSKKNEHVAEPFHTLLNKFSAPQGHPQVTEREREISADICVFLLSKGVPLHVAKFFHEEFVRVLAAYRDTVREESEVNARLSEALWWDAHTVATDVRNSDLDARVAAIRDEKAKLRPPASPGSATEATK
jgi:hypothetical protein